MAICITFPTPNMVDPLKRWEIDHGYLHHIPTPNMVDPLKRWEIDHGYLHHIPHSQHG